MHDGSALLGIESVKEGVYCEGGHLHRVGGRTEKAVRVPPPRRHQDSYYVTSWENVIIWTLGRDVIKSRDISLFSLRGMHVMGYLGRLHR